MNLKGLIAILFLCVFAFYSCERDELTEETPTQTFEQPNDGKTVLGKKLENPYSVENMKKALAELKASNKLKSSTVDEIEIETTHLYVRFFPKSDKELQILESDSLELFDYPLDYEIEQYGESYQDPDVNPEDGQWYYTSVPVEYDFPEVQYEVLEELFLPESIESTNKLKSASTKTFLYNLEDEALRITGNLEEEIEDYTGLKSSKIYPEGTVTVKDTERNKFVGVENVRVRTRRWFSYGYAWTNSTGYYKINRRYRRSVHYTVFFENSSGFKIRASIISLWKAKHHVGKHNRRGYDIDIDTGSRAWRFATVNNAVVKYFRYCKELKIGLPPTDLRLVASDNSGGGAAPMLKRMWGFYGLTSKHDVISFLGKTLGLPVTVLGNTFFKFVLPDIIVKANSGQGTASVFGTCFHELAHASHYNKVGRAYWIKYINYIITYGSYGKGTNHNAGLCALGEAWGYHMGYKLTLEEFKNVGTSTNNSLITWSVFEDFEPYETGNKDNDIPRWANNSGKIVRWAGWIPAGIMNDIVDNNTDLFRSAYRDSVSGYTHQDLFDALDKDVDSPQKFRDRLLSENDTLDQADLKKLFEAYYWN